MRKIFLLLIVWSAIALPLNAQHKARHLRLAFGSCSKQQSENQLWDEVIRQKPDAWIWLGDNIYGDTHNMDSLRSMYDRQKSRPSYQQLIRSMPVFGTWDDHDYGVNDGGKFFSRKAESQQLMLDFLGVPSDAPVRRQAGVYQSYLLGSGKAQVKLILLDTRYFRDTLAKSAVKGVRYQKNPEGDVLGEAQWQWLEQELRSSTASVNLIASSIQFISEEHGFEHWANFPSARGRMLELLGRVRPKGVVFLSGDRHIAEVSEMQVSGLSYPLVDITSSGLTHTWSTGSASEPNRHRKGMLLAERNFGLLDLRYRRNIVDLTIFIIGPGNKRLAGYHYRY